MLFRELETDRLFLKNISTEDREFILAVFSNDEVNRFLFDAEPLKDIQEADGLIDFYTQEEPRGHHRWVLVRKDDGVKLGTCGFHCWDKSTDCCDIGYDLLPEFWGQGYMLEAMRVIIDFARSDMKLKSINACIYADNKKSINLAEKCGFTFEGKIKDEVFRGEKYPHRIFSLILCEKKMILQTPPPILETERLVLLPWKMEYAEDMLLFAANENVANARNVKPITNIKNAKAKIKGYIDRNIDDWAIALKTKSGNKIVGSIGLYKHAKSWKEFNKYNLSFNLVYLIAEEYWGMGICTEAAKKVMHYAFVGIKCDALGANHTNKNNRSRRVIEKCGFIKISREHDENPNATVKYCISKEDYFSLYT